MATTGINNAFRHVHRDRVDRFFLRMNRREIAMVSRVMHRSKGRSLSVLQRAINTLCNGWIYLPLAVWLILQREWRLMIVAALGTTISFLLYYLTKPVLARIRPCNFATGLSTGLQYLDQYSFPSGHCMTMSVVSVLICWQHHAAIPALIAMILLVSWARVAAAHHYPSDLVAGIAIGLSVGLILARELL
jgi:undecaprenyl-diphosphatase